MQATSNDYGILVLRLTLGLALLAHGLLKYFVFTLPGTVGFFGSLGLPPIAAYLVFIGEVGGGLLIILGYQTRIISALMVPILLGATVVHVPNGWLFSAQGGGWEYPAFMTAASVALVFSGDGVLSLKNKLHSQPQPQTETA